MSEELRPCPFCGTEAEQYLKIPAPGLYHASYVYCPLTRCPIHRVRFDKIEWNSRPIEDALRADLARKDEEIKALNELRRKLDYESFILSEFAERMAISAIQAKTLRDVQSETYAARARLAKIREER